MDGRSLPVLAVAPMPIRAPASNATARCWPEQGRRPTLRSRQQHGVIARRLPSVIRQCWRGSSTGARATRLASIAEPPIAAATLWRPVNPGIGLPTCAPHALCTTWVTWEMGFRSLSAAETDTASKRLSRRYATNAPDKAATVVPAIGFRRSAQPGTAPSRGLSSGRASWPNGVAADRRGCCSRPRRSRYRHPASSPTR